MPRKSTGRRPGAPLGNTNHLLHGAYARHISVEIAGDIKSMPEDRNQEELALARSRVVICIDKQMAAPPSEWPFYEHIVARYLREISRLTQMNAILGKDSKGALITVLEVMRQVNEKEGVR